MNSSVLTNTWTVCALLATAGTAFGASRIDVADFAGAAQTVQGGLYRSTGASPDLVGDRLTRDDADANGTWRIDIAAGAPSSRVGGVIPLFCDRVGTPDPKMLDAQRMKFLKVRVRGALGDRVLQVELVSGLVIVPQRWGGTVGTLHADDVSADGWRTFAFPINVDGLDLSQLGAVRLMFEGHGAAWAAVDAVWFATDQDATDPPSTVTEKPKRLRQAMWVWKTAEILPDSAKVAELLDFSGKHGITDLYCQIPYDYAGGVVAMALVEEQRTFNAAAHRAGITVHALDGAPDFVFKRNHERMFKLVEALDAFNRAGDAASRYPAIHLDNEPYVLAEWKNPAKRRAVLRDYIALNRALREKTKAAGMEFGVDIPFWWDGVDAAGRAVFRVKTPAGEVPLLEALFPLVDNVGIMSYRERVTGRDGVIGCCMTEFDLGARFGVEVFASIELGTDVEPGISMGRFPLAYFQRQLRTLQAALAHTRGCSGFAIHYYSKFMTWEKTS